MNIKDINTAIITQSWTADELQSMADAIRFARSTLARKNIFSFNVGQRVKFTHPKTGRVHVGEVRKVKIKNVTVAEGISNWNVPANMLAPA